MRLFCPLTISDFPLWSISGVQRRQKDRIRNSAPQTEQSFPSRCEIMLRLVSHKEGQHAGWYSLCIYLQPILFHAKVTLLFKKQKLPGGILPNIFKLSSFSPTFSDVNKTHPYQCQLKVSFSHLNKCQVPRIIRRALHCRIIMLEFVLPFQYNPLPFLPFLSLLYLYRHLL